MQKTSDYGTHSESIHNRFILVETKTIWAIYDFYIYRLEHAFDLLFTIIYHEA